MERAKVAASTACYLMKDGKVLLIHFNKKWGQVYAPPGGKIIEHESPLECILREFKEETGLILEDPKLKGYSYWDWMQEEQGIIFFYTATSYTGSIKEGAEGKLSWINLEDMKKLKQFDMNSKFTDLIFEDGIFEGHFELDENNQVKTYKITKI